MDLDDFIITVFCVVDEAIPAVLKGQGPATAPATASARSAADAGR